MHVIVSDGHRANHLHDSELYILKFYTCSVRDERARLCRCVSVVGELPTVSRSSVDLKFRVNDGDDNGDDNDDILMHSRLM